MPETLLPSSTAATAEEQRDALAAPIRDPLWLLARQWQTGGFLADDAGSPVGVRLAHAVAPLAAPDGARPAALEPWVEAEPLPSIAELDHGRQVGLATELVRRLRLAGAAAAAPVLTGAFRYDPAGAGPSIRPFRRRLPDPAGLRDALVPALGPTGEGGGSLPPFPGLPAGLTAAVERACRGWLGWLAERVAPPGAADASADPAAWDPRRLEYRFELTAGLPSAAVRLPVEEYHGAGVEWYAFDRAEPDAAGGSGQPAAAVEVQPVPVGYPGMPRPRFWEFEDGAVNLDLLAGTDPAHAVLVAFAHRFANDWFLVPLTVPPGLCEITALTVTDTFGTTTDAPAVAAADGGTGPWRLWELSTAAADPAAGAGLRLLVPPTPRPLAGEPVEDVLLVRDEMANLAWLVERVTQNADGGAVDRYQRYLRLRPAADPSFDPAGAPDARATYRLGTALPDYWYPLVAATDPAGRPLLALAALPPGAAGVGDDGVRGRLVDHSPGSTLADEEVPREGAHVIRQDRLLTGGRSVVVWRGRTKCPGLGEGSSGLRFDVLE